MSAPYNPEHVTYFGETDFRSQKTKFGIKSRDRTRHMYVIGKSGVGKSTLLENMAIQDIEAGAGVAVLDPHGSFAEKMLEYIPAERIKDVVYFAPFDTNYPISFNVLEDVGADKRHFVASGLMSTFKKIWVDAWSARMEYILNNILLALLEYPDATLLGVNRMLSDKTFRNKVVENVTDPGVKTFWVDEFAKYGERYMQEAGAAIQNKIGQFTANPLVRNIIGQPKSSFDVRKLMDEQKIFIINLSKGRIGEQNTALLGSMIITKIYLSAMSRAEASPQLMATLPNFYFYVDEFQSFANETFADILAEARKYKLALIIAHQYVAQMEEKVRDAVFGNVGTTISFRVGPLDAELLEKVMAPQFTQNDLINLGMAQIYLTLMINDIGSMPFSARTLPPLPRPTISYRNDVIEWSRATYASPRDVVENATKEWYIKDIEPVREPRSEKRVTFADGVPPRQQGFQKPLQHQPFKQTLPAMAPFKPKEVIDRPQQGASKSYTPVQPKQSDQQKIIKPVQTVRQSVEDTPKKEEILSEIVQPIKQEPPVIVSPTLGALLSALDTDTAPKEIEIPFRKDPGTPFEGEKPLRQAIIKQPVKVADRGPSEKNKELLKAALAQALIPHNQKKVEQPETSVALEQSAATQQQSTVMPSINTDTAPKEIDYQTLRKVLE